MMESGMSAADVMALSNNDGFSNGNAWFWIVVLFLFGYGGNGFGNNSNGTADLNASMQRGFDNQNVMQRFDTLAQNQTANAYDNASLIAQNKYDNAVLIKDAQYTNLQNTNALQSTINSGFDGIDKSICQSTYATTQAMNDGFAGVQRGLCDISHQISDGVCAIKTQMLQDKYDDLLNSYNLSTMANSNAVQTQNILSAMGNWYAKAPYTPPYYYGTTVGTTIG